MTLPKSLSLGEEMFALHCRVDGLEPEREHRFEPKRKWRVDFAFPDAMLAVEIEGGIWSGGRHTRGAGYSADMAKYNALTLKGWGLLRFSTQMVESGEAINIVREALSARMHLRGEDNDRSTVD